MRRIASLAPARSCNSSGVVPAPVFSPINIAYTCCLQPPDYTRPFCKTLTSSFEFPADVGEPRWHVRTARLMIVLVMAARIYVRYKAIQFWSRFVSDRHKAARYRRQDL